MNNQYPRKRTRPGLSSAHFKSLVGVYLFVTIILFIFGDPFIPWSKTTTFKIPSTPSEISRSEDIFWHEVASGDTLGKIFNLNRLDFRVIEQILTLKGVENLRKPIVGDRISIRRRNGVLSSVSVERGPAYQLTVERSTDGNFVVSERRLEPKRFPIAIEVLLRQSILEDSLNAGVPEKVVDSLGKILGRGVDLANEVVADGKIRIVYEGLYYGGEYFGPGQILFAQYIGPNQEYSVTRYISPNQKQNEYYTINGRNSRTAFLRTPLKNFIRISSHYDLQRKHPTLHRIIAHKGVDFAAPLNSEIVAAGDGRVTFAGKARGFGNLIIIDHGNGYETRYGHLNRFSPGIIEKTQVRQGEVIGYVGNTGLSTGPHLHYEFLVNKKHTNPVEVPLPSALPVTGIALGLVESQLMQYKSMFDLVTVNSIATDDNF